MNPRHLELLRLGAASLDEWRADNPASRLDLRGASLSGRRFAGWNLSRALLDHADLAGADLSGADLSEASLKWANLEGAKMRNAVLYRATLVGSNLRNADLTNAAMYRVSLKDANIEGADFTAATMQKVIMPAERQALAGACVSQASDRAYSPIAPVQRRIVSWTSSSCSRVRSGAFSPRRALTNDARLST